LSPGIIRKIFVQAGEILENFMIFYKNILFFDKNNYFCIKRRVLLTLLMKQYNLKII